MLFGELGCELRDQAFGARVILRHPPVQADHDALVLDHEARYPQLLDPSASFGENVLHVVFETGHLGSELHTATNNAFGSVQPPYLDARPQPFDELHGRASRNHAYDAEQPAEVVQDVGDPGERACLFGARDDLRKSAVEVEEETRLAGGTRQFVHRAGHEGRVTTLVPMTKRLAAGAVLILLVSACRSDAVDLAYRFPDQASLVYEMVADAEANWDIAGEGRGSYTVTFEVTETIESVDAEGAVVDVTMNPTDVQEEGGFIAPATTERTFKLQVGAHGEVRDVLEVDDIPASALDPDQRLFIGTYRPLLPLDPVGLDDEWPGSQEFQGEEFQRITTLGTLEALNTDDDGDYAELSYSGRGPLVWQTSLPEGQAELTGSARISGDARLDIEDGFLRSATSTTEGDFDVNVVPEEAGNPIAGTLHLKLDLDLENIDVREAEQQT
jgi:hypothetical protein